MEQDRREFKRRELEGARKALARVRAERDMYGATPRNGLEFMEASAMYHALKAAEMSLKATVYDLTAELEAA